MSPPIWNGHADPFQKIFVHNPTRFDLAGADLSMAVQVVMIEQHRYDATQWAIALGIVEEWQITAALIPAKLPPKGSGTGMATLYLRHGHLQWTGQVFIDDWEPGKNRLTGFGPLKQEMAK